METVSSHPVLTLDGAKRFEKTFFDGDEAKEWTAMQRAGRAIGAAILADFQELAPFPSDATLIVLAGKGHNAGDALIAAQTILEQRPRACAKVWLLFGPRSLRPLAARAYRELVQAAPGRVTTVASFDALAGGADVLLDGVFGFQFHAPLPPGLATLFAQVDKLPVRLRAAVDLPSGLGDTSALRADFTYATGSVKAPVLDDGDRAIVGRVRYLDLGFFIHGPEVGRTVPGEPRLGETPRPTDAFDAADRVLTPDILAPLRRLRPAVSDKRTYGHVFILGGSRSYPGAVLMSAQAAARSGAGLITAFVPESLAAAFAARLPEVIWVGWPETPSGGLALEGLHLLRERVDRADALLLGPGAGREPETLALFTDVAKTSTMPLVIDADALQPEIVRAGSASRVLTPHAGEFARIARDAGLPEFSKAHRAVTVLKGPLTRISDGVRVYHNCFGGSVLARGGSGDLLAGLIGGLLAQTPAEPLLAACRGAVWHGRAADVLARRLGQIAVQTTQLLDCLGDALRES